MTEELDSQLSAMFDDELPQAECELLARRFARDDALRQRWGRYAAMRACFREEGSAHSVRIAARVRAQLGVERELHGDATMRSRRSSDAFGRRWRQPVAGIAVACGVAALAIFWVRTQTFVAGPASPAAPLTAYLDPRPAAASVPPMPTGASQSSNEPDSYVVPAATDTPAFAPTTELANYVVAHSEYSSPLNRRSLLSSFVASESTSPPVSIPPQIRDRARDRPNAD
jgi:sigma-E factor negative regulatory protein RseA